MSGILTAASVRIAAAGGGGGGGYTLGVSVATAGNASTVTTSAIDTTGATLLVGSVNDYNSLGTFTDSKGNTWTELTRYGSGQFFTRIVWCIPTSVGSGHTFTSDGNYPVIVMAAFTGNNATPQDNGNGTNVDSTSIQPGSITPSADNCLVVSTVCAATATTVAINTGESGWTIIGQANNSSAMTGAIAYKIQTTAAATNPTWTHSPSNYLASSIRAFKPV